MAVCVQDLMDYDWFEQECDVQQPEPEEVFVVVAYFVPITRLLTITQPG